MTGLFLNSWAQEEDTGERELVNCLAINGLSLREFPNSDSSKVLTIPYASSIEFIYRTDNRERINGFDGNWIQAEYNDSVGYIFDAYVSALPAPRLFDRFSYLNSNRVHDTRY